MTAIVLLPVALGSLTVGLLFLPLAWRGGYRAHARDMATATTLTSFQQAAMDAPGRYRGRRRLTWRVQLRRWVAARRPLPVQARPLPALIGRPGAAYLYAHMRAVAG